MGSTSTSRVYSSSILPKTNKGRVMCWPIHKTPAGFSRAFPAFNKGTTCTVWNGDVSVHATLKRSHRYCEMKSLLFIKHQKERFAATQNWSQGNKSSEQANHKPQHAPFQKSAPPQTVPAVLYSLFWLSSTSLCTTPKAWTSCFSIISPL